ncbi:MAG: 2-isopropylmalate synthase [Bacillota bacterium]
MKNIKFFDTTLRDGEQSPGCSMNLKEKIKMAKRLEKLNVDVIEAGFAIASKGDFESVKKIAETVDKPVVASLARALKKDIDIAYDAVKNANKPRIHTFIATSPLHREYKLKMSKKEILEKTKNMVEYAKSKCDDIEFSAEDATRTEKEFLVKVFNCAIKAGANVINIPDTVGYTTPNEFYELVNYVKKNLVKQVEISVHCHNDLGLAVANSLSALKAGATQIECTINGIGERAGNAAIEELAMILKTRKDFYDFSHNLNTKEIMKTSNTLSNITGVSVQPNKAIVGKNAFAHESGIHQHGVLANKSTYEIMSPDDIGLKENTMVLGKHSGKHAFKERIVSLGYDLSSDELKKAFEIFKDLADKKKEIYQSDLEAIITDDIYSISKKVELTRYVVNCGNTINPTVTIQVKYDGEILEEVASGDGVVDSSFKAIEKIFSLDLVLKDYKIKSISKGKDALGEARIVIEHNNQRYYSKGLSTDVVEASIKAYINAVDKILRYKEAEIA